MTRSLETALAGTGLELSEYDVLVTVAQEQSGLRPSELAERVLLTKSGVTRLVDRLAERGLLIRQACPTDRRGQLVLLTPAGRRLLRRAAPALTRSLASLMGVLSPPQLADLAQAGARLTEAATRR